MLHLFFWHISMVFLPTILSLLIERYCIHSAESQFPLPYVCLFCLFYFHILYDTLLILYIYVLLVLIDYKRKFINKKGHFGSFRENMSLTIWQKTAGCCHRRLLVGASLVSLWQEIFAYYRRLWNCSLTYYVPLCSITTCWKSENQTDPGHKSWR